MIKATVVSEKLGGLIMGEGGEASSGEASRVVARLRKGKAGQRVRVLPLIVFGGGFTIDFLYWGFVPVVKALKKKNKQTARSRFERVRSDDKVKARQKSRKKMNHVAYACL